MILLYISASGAKTSIIPENSGGSYSDSSCFWSRYWMLISLSTFMIEYLLLLTSSILLTATYLPVIMHEALTTTLAPFYEMVSTMR